MLGFSDARERSAFRRRLFTWRVGLRWYVLALIIGAGAWLAGGGIMGALGKPLTISLTVLRAALIFFITVFVEEVGWRGFALPRFLSRYSWLRSGLLLGILWSVWHAPDYLREPWGLYAALFATLLMILTTQSIIMGWIFQRAGGVMPPLVLLHWASNLMSGIFYAGGYSVDTITAFLQLRAVVAVLMILVAGSILVHDGRTRRQNEAEPDGDGGVVV